MLPVERAASVFFPLSLAESRILASVGLDRFILGNVLDAIQIGGVLSSDEKGVKLVRLLLLQAQYSVVGA